MSYADFTAMPVWQLALNPLIKIYATNKSFPVEERYGLVSDMPRAANSITHNIAKSFGYFEPGDKSRFYKISRGSAYELITQILVSLALSYLSSDLKSDLIAINNQIIKALNAIIKTLETQVCPSNND